jgi:hypothetical protein
MLSNIMSNLHLLVKFISEKQLIMKPGFYIAHFFYIVKVKNNTKYQNSAIIKGIHQ